MRVIAGTARRLLLKTPEGLDTRPTTDRIKETLFNILQPDLPGCQFLDLFAGSGGIGIEALSRGAARAVFVDNGREAIRCIRENLLHTKLENRSLVIPGDVSSALSDLSRRGEAFDIVFLDPPYGSPAGIAALKQLALLGLAGEDTLVILEESISFTLPDDILELYQTERVKDYKTNKHFFLRRRQTT